MPIRVNDYHAGLFIERQEMIEFTYVSGKTKIYCVGKEGEQCHCYRLESNNNIIKVKRYSTEYPFDLIDTQGAKHGEHFSFQQVSFDQKTNKEKTKTKTLVSWSIFERQWKLHPESLNTTGEYEDVYYDQYEPSSIQIAPVDHTNDICKYVPVLAENYVERLAAWVTAPDGTYPEIDEFSKKLLDGTNGGRGVKNPFTELVYENTNEKPIQREVPEKRKQKVKRGEKVVAFAHHTIHPPPATVWFKKPIVLIPAVGCGGCGCLFVLIIFLGIVGAIITDQPNENRNRNTKTTANNEKISVDVIEDAITISASDLAQAFVDNAVAANSNYKGKTLIVSGEIDTIEETFGLAYVTLKTNELLYSVQCSFSSKDKELLASLRKGNQISIKGKCTGTMGNVGLKNCSVVK